VETSRESKPSAQRLSFIAFKVLEQAAFDARHGPITPAIAHRLALGWLAYIGISEPWRTELFWKTIGNITHFAQHAQMMRDRDLGRCLNGWRRLIGLPPKDPWYLTPDPRLIGAVHDH